MTTTLRVVAAVFVAGDTVLACRRAPGRSAAGAWEFPGGKREPGEAAPAALIREIREELGVDITVTELLDRSTTPITGAVIDLACYFVTSSTPPTHSSDHDLLEWVPRHRLGERRWAEPDEPAVRKLRHLDPFASPLPRRPGPRVTRRTAPPVP